MNNGRNLHKVDLVSHKDQSLAKRKARLEDCGLRSIRDSKDRQIRVLVGNIDDQMTDLFLECIREAIGPQYDLRGMWAWRLNEILERAQKHRFDLFILVLNNILFPTGMDTKKDRLERMLMITRHISKVYGKPLIAMTGWWPEWLDESSFAGQVKRAGANCFFRLPFDVKPFMGAVKEFLCA